MTKAELNQIKEEINNCVSFEFTAEEVEAVRAEYNKALNDRTYVNPTEAAQNNAYNYALGTVCEKAGVKAVYEISKKCHEAARKLYKMAIK